jgi:hypothetical protein
MLFSNFHCKKESNIMARPTYPKSKIYGFVADWLTTSLTITSYCKKHQLKPGNFYRWIKDNKVDSFYNPLNLLNF